MHHSDDKFGALIWVRVPKDLRDTKVSARNIKGFSPLLFIVICCYLPFSAPQNPKSLKKIQKKFGSKKIVTTFAVC